MKVLLDEFVPRQHGRFFPDDFGVYTVQDMGGSGRANGDLIQLARSYSFKALVTVDQGFENQQNLMSCRSDLISRFVLNVKLVMVRIRCDRAHRCLCNLRDGSESQLDDEMQRQPSASQNPHLAGIDAALTEVVAGEIQASQYELATNPYIQNIIGDVNQLKSEIRACDSGIQFARSAQLTVLFGAIFT